MTLFDSNLAAFTAEAEQAFAGNVVIATIEECTWLSRFAPLAERDGGAGWMPSVRAEAEHVATCDWYGLLDLWRDTPERVLVRRHMMLGPYGDVHAVTVAAARTRECLDRAVLHGQDLWHAWRRNAARVRSARGKDVAVSSVAWEDLYLPVSTLDEIRANVTHFAGAQALYKELGLAYRRGLLFYGAPGNGKTMICRAIVSALDWPVVYVSPQSRQDSADELARAFSEAKKLAPCVLWFDDVDSLFDTDATMSGFLNHLDGASASEGLLVLATTNRPENLDPAIVARPSRFDRIFEISCPAAPERDRYFARRFGERLSAAAREDLVRRTAGMSMAFVQEVFVGAALRALQRGEMPNDEDAREVHTALSKHIRVADRRFEAHGEAGFTR